ncbi:ABC transporter substrate-binding protein [Dyadobacter psychrophilus]|uniref:Iron complex transport system substrate-binding protein n=1 Tax=Dyadobacter psychrophilus TaxID=651661 RepID=A0A1T5G788_9BACT|nr:ABC transporter substrate-binding protein [Dyadobacter psychrophilus]SKC04256.1 iron complex transport system substrate-binding protein [Dyadobacter psychrophilus]
MIFIIACSTSSTLYEKGESGYEGPALFKEKVVIRHAKGFTIDYHKNFKLVKIMSPFEKATDTMSFVLLQRGTPKPAGYQNAQIIQIPIQSLVPMSSMHIGLVGYLSAEHIVTGMGNLTYVSSEKIRARIKSGDIKEVGKDQGLNEELLIAMHPDLVMTIGSPVSKINRYQSLKQAGIPVMINSEWIETTPLARAEWVKLMAALLNRESEVNTKFSESEKEYARLVKLAKSSKTQPSLVSGMNSKDAWFVPSGSGYVSRFFRDAGARYHWADTKATGSLPLNFEAVYPVALNADFWLNVGILGVKSKRELLDKDQRYADFKAFKAGNIFTHNKRQAANGANDYWESGAVNPHVVLADLIKILHPELLPGHTLFYYQKLE